jgi:hypothetical protein
LESGDASIVSADGESLAVLQYPIGQLLRRRCPKPIRR